MRRRPRPARVLVAAVALCAVACAAPLAWFGRHLRRVEVAGASMTPALAHGDFVVVRSGPPPAGHAFGQIVAVHDPRPVGDSRLLLKRVVGLPGESLRVGGGPVQINGRVLIEPYAHGEGPYEQHRGINRLAADEYFLLGDHRGASTDSRDFGPVRRADIEGTAVFRYWPASRIGRIRPPERQLAGPDADSGTPSAVSPADHDHPIPIAGIDAEPRTGSGSA